MATQLARQSYTFIDAKGFPWTMRCLISYDDTSITTLGNGVTVAENLREALIGAGPSTLALTNGSFRRMGGLGGKQAAFAYGAAAQYLNAEDKLMVAFLDTDSNIHRYGIGSPVLAAFLADQETGKGTQLADFVAAMTTATGAARVVTSSGLALVSAVGSVLVRRRQRRKVTLLSKSANLDEPGE